MKKSITIVAVMATVGYVASAFAGRGMGGYGQRGGGWYHRGWGDADMDTDQCI